VSNRTLNLITAAVIAVLIGIAGVAVLALLVVGLGAD